MENNQNNSTDHSRNGSSQQKKDNEYCKIRNQRQQILMFIGQHCAYIRLNEFGKSNFSELDGYLGKVTYLEFKRFVMFHTEIAKANPALKSYEFEISTLLKWYSDRIEEDLHQVFESDNGWSNFYETYTELINNANIKTK